MFRRRANVPGLTVLGLRLPNGYTDNSDGFFHLAELVSYQISGLILSPLLKFRTRIWSPFQLYLWSCCFPVRWSVIPLHRPTYPAGFFVKSSGWKFLFIFIILTMSFLLRHFSTTGWIVTLQRRESYCRIRSVVCNISYMDSKASNFLSFVCRLRSTLD